MDKEKKKRPYSRSGEGSSCSKKPSKHPQCYFGAESALICSQQQRAQSCVICGGSHRVTSCPEGAGKCYQCGQSGHVKANCTDRSNVTHTKNGAIRSPLQTSLVAVVFAAKYLTEEAVVMYLVSVYGTVSDRCMPWLVADSSVSVHSFLSASCRRLDLGQAYSFENFTCDFAHCAFTNAITLILLQRKTCKEMKRLRIMILEICAHHRLSDSVDEGSDQPSSIQHNKFGSARSADCTDCTGISDSAKEPKSSYIA
uniref:CCHC-type domain-containing protein n=1 Tax=Ananas comosus var. bracteatus TaxID=296719 RepID=A0A6V7PM16_ANACO|nr:unnamed protein product [Ananas comosus var. bracteatus]